MSFCAGHRSEFGETDQICIRDTCRRKHLDLAEHVVFRDRALLRNRHRLCGIEECMAERWGQCSKCHALYCEGHIVNRAETVRQGMASFSRPASYCLHCLARRKLWSRQ
jgi:hypothetical protein